MREIRKTRRLLVCVAIATAAILAACGDDSDALHDANVDVKRIEGESEGLHARVTEAEERAEEANTALREARADLAKLEKKLAAARLRVEEKASDATVFRAVQGRLLEERKLEDVAISAQVHDRVVTLQGSVPDPELRKRAEEVAAATPGVLTVVNQIQLEAEVKQ